MSLFPKYQDLLKQKYIEFLSLTLLSPSNNWKKAVQKDSLIIHTHKDSKGVTSIRSEGLIPFPRDTILKIFWDDIEALKRVDDSIADYRIIDISPDENQIIVHNKLKPAPLVTPRDIVMIIARVREQSQYVIYGSSIKYPEEKGSVRAECIIWGWLFKEDKQNKQHTWAININYTDLAGSIPSFVVKPVLIKEHGYLIKRARDYLKSNQPMDNKKTYQLDKKIVPKL